MLRFVDWPLRAKMGALLVIASLLPLVVSALIDIREARQRLLENTAVLLAARGDELVGELDTFHRGYRRSVEILARLPRIVDFCRSPRSERDPLKRDVNSVLQIHATDKSVRGTAILDAEGTVQVATEEQLVGVPFAFNPYVQAALKGSTVISDIHLGGPEVGHAPTIAYVAPTLGLDGKVTGLAVLWVRATALWDIARASNELAGAKSFAVLFDRTGIRIAHTYNDDIVFHPGGALDSETLGALVAQRRFGERTRELLEDVRAFPEQFDRARSESPDRAVFRGFAPVNHKWNYGVARRFETVPWTVFYMIPEESLRAQIAQMTRDRTVFAAVIIVVALAAGTFFATTVSSPIQALYRATELLSRGVLTARVEVARADELGRLGSGFNRMADRIQDLLRERDEQAAALRLARDDLEVRVQERTADLARTTRNLELEIGERKRAEDALRAGERNLAITLDSIGDAVIATDVEGRITRMNPVAEQLTGWPLDQAKGRALSDIFHIVNEETRRPVENPAARVLGEGVIVGLANHTTLISRNGSERPIADSGAPIRDPGGAISGVVLVFRDQTDERKMEEVRFKSLQLEAQNLRVQAASRLKSEFLANMSHELRTPLNAIIGFTELIYDGEVRPEMPQYQEFLGDILASGRHLLQLINDVLDLSKVEAGKLQFRPESVNVILLIREVLGILRTTFAAKAIRIESHVEPSLTGVELDAARFKQVLYNYVSNAVKFTPDGGRVIVRARPEPGGSAFRLEVEDNGVGIAADDLSRLFVEFQQLDAGAAKKHSGTGLGLALTKRLVEAQGGTVGVRSTLGRGSTFHAILPRQTTSGSPAAGSQTFQGVHDGVPVDVVAEDRRRTP
jgi:PAS domain S-box-containing protein